VGLSVCLTVVDLSILNRASRVEMEKLLDNKIAQYAKFIIIAIMMRTNMGKADSPKTINSLHKSSFSCCSPSFIFISFCFFEKK